MSALCVACDGNGYTVEFFDGEYVGWQPGPSEYGREERYLECRACEGEGVVPDEDEDELTSAGAGEPERLSSTPASHSALRGAGDFFDVVGSGQ